MSSLVRSKELMLRRLYPARCELLRHTTQLHHRPDFDGTPARPGNAGGDADGLIRIPGVDTSPDNYLPSWNARGIRSSRRRALPLGLGADRLDPHSSGGRFRIGRRRGPAESRMMLSSTAPG